MFAIVHTQFRYSTILMATSFVFLPIFLATTSFAGGMASQIAEAVPAQIPEMITGGKWRKGNIQGYYRAMVVMPENGNTSKTTGNAEVLIQWIGKEEGAYRSKIFKTVNVKEVSRKSLQHAFLSMDTLKDNEMTLLVSSYDEKRNKDISISVKATMPGEYRPGK